MDKEIVFNCPCPICGKEIGRRHGIICDDCRSAQISDMLTGDSLVKTIDEITRVQIAEKIKQMTEEKHQIDYDIKMEPISPDIIRGQLNVYQEIYDTLKRRHYEK